MEERLRSRLLRGDEAEAHHQVLGLRDKGVPATEIITHLFVPALRAIGDGWAAGDVTIPEEHRASAIVARLLGELTPNPSGRRRGRVVVAALSGEHHGLPTAMAAAALREDRWNVEHLGSDVPAEEIVRFATDSSADLVVLSVTALDGVEAAKQAARAITDAGVPAIVGQAGATLQELLEAARAQAPAARRGSRRPGGEERSDRARD
jgi:methanogenic corrinoid protein MtbC1